MVDRYRIWPEGFAAHMRPAKPVDMVFADEHDAEIAGIKAERAPAERAAVKVKAADIAKDAIRRCRELHDYAGRPAWEKAVEDAILYALEPAAPGFDEWEGEITDPVEQASADQNRAAHIAAAKHDTKPAAGYNDAPEAVPNSSAPGMAAVLNGEHDG